MTILHVPSWFPRADKPLDGNFIFRQIAAVEPYATCIILHHVNKSSSFSYDFPSGILFEPVKADHNIDKIQLWRAYRQSLENIIKRYGKPDLIHLHVALPLGPMAAYFSKHYHIPLLISEHWSIYQSQNRKQLNCLQRVLLHYTYRQAKGITAVSQNLLDAIHDCISATRKLPCRVISNAVDTELFRPLPPPVAPHTTKKRILHISSLENKSKNIMGILRAVEKVAVVRRDFELDIIHDLPNPEVADYIRRHHLETIIQLLGKKTEHEVAEAIRNSDFLLQFSNYETQSCVLLEAFACGKPVLTTPVGGIPEIAHEGNALFVEPCDETQLAEKISFMLDHTSSFDGNAIRREAELRYSYQAVGNLFYTFYRDIPAS